MTVLRAAVVQAAPVAFDREESIDLVGRLTTEARARGSELVLFPEAFVSAYPWGSDFGARMGSRTDAGRDEFRRYWESGLEVPSADCDRIGGIAADNQVYLVLGVIERDGGTLYCTALFFAPDGQLLGKHRKLMPTASERLVWGCGDGSTLPVFDTPLGRLGAVICWENYMPLVRMAMYAKGIQIYCAPTADSRDTWLASMRHVALEGRCFVLSSCQFARHSDYADNSHESSKREASSSEADDRILSRGGSCIIDPFGEILAGPDFSGPCTLVADLDLDQIPRGKFDFDVVGHYARPDVFQLRVNDRPTSAVVFDSDPAALQRESRSAAAHTSPALNPQNDPQRANDPCDSSSSMHR
ncbi:MAG: nitrilase-related carbon-nitrogen hydrolase [Planctomycetaceae bacterium]